VDEDAVVVAVAENEPEAEMLCNLLRDAGIECGYRDTPPIDSTIEDFTAAGRREILVHPNDLERARAVLPAA
jgi:putative signal transducing protein